MPPSFIETPFTTKVAYEKWLEAGAPMDQLSAGMAAVDLSDAGASTTWEVLTFPPARRALVRAEFDKAAQDGKVALKEVWKILFSEVERGEYDFDSFDTDVQATTSGDTMTWAAIEKFLDENL
jgi:hypothetical protein